MKRNQANPQCGAPWGHQQSMLRTQSIDDNKIFQNMTLHTSSTKQGPNLRAEIKVLRPKRQRALIYLQAGDTMKTARDLFCF